MGFSAELSLFATPWHWIVHGLGLGQCPRDFDAGRANRVLAISDALTRQCDDVFHGFVDALLRVVVARCEGKAETGAAPLINRLASLQDPHEHARACALLVDVLVKIELVDPRDNSLKEQLGVALARLTALPSGNDRERYQTAHLLGNLILAAGQAQWLDLAGVASAIAAALRLLDGIENTFYRGRGTAILLTILGIIGAPAAHRVDEREPVEYLMRLLDRAFESIPTDPPDGVHAGRDYRLFPLLLTMTAVGVLRRGDRLHDERAWVELARAELGQVTPRSRASQTLFYVSALRNLGLLDRYVPDREALLRQTTEAYLNSTDGRQPDDYLRCTYLVHLARQLGCGDVLSLRITRILSDSVSGIAGSTQYRENPYASGYLVLAYVLSTAQDQPSLDLAGAVAGVKDDSSLAPTQRARLDFALVDEALRLRSRKLGNTPLFEKVFQ